MPALTINFADIQDFEPLVPGRYPVVVDSVELRTNKAETGQYLNWSLIVTEGEYANRHMFFTTSLGEKSLWRLKAVFSNLGALPEDGMLEIVVDDDTNMVTEPALVGLVAVADVKNEVYEGRIRDRVSDLLAADVAPSKPVTIAPRPAPVAPVRQGPPPVATRSTVAAPPPARLKVK